MTVIIIIIFAALIFFIRGIVTLIVRNKDKTKSVILRLKKVWLFISVFVIISYLLHLLFSRFEIVIVNSNFDTIIASIVVVFSYLLVFYLLHRIYLFWNRWKIGTILMILNSIFLICAIVIISFFFIFGLMINVQDEIIFEEMIENNRVIVLKQTRDSFDDTFTELRLIAVSRFGIFQRVISSKTVKDYWDDTYRLEIVVIREENHYIYNLKNKLEYDGLDSSGKFKLLIPGFGI